MHSSAQSALTGYFPYLYVTRHLLVHSNYLDFVISVIRITVRLHHHMMYMCIITMFTRLYDNIHNSPWCPGGWGAQLIILFLKPKFVL